MYLCPALFGINVVGYVIRIQLYNIYLLIFFGMFMTFWEHWMSKEYFAV
jgi:hypothetical protein